MVVLHLRSASHPLGISVGQHMANAPEPTVALQQFWVVQKNNRTKCTWNSTAYGAEWGDKRAYFYH